MKNFVVIAALPFVINAENESQAVSQVGNIIGENVDLISDMGANPEQYVVLPACEKSWPDRHVCGVLFTTIDSENDDISADYVDQAAFYQIETNLKNLNIDYEIVIDTGDNRVIAIELIYDYAAHDAACVAAVALAD